MFWPQSTEPTMHQAFKTKLVRTIKNKNRKWRKHKRRITLAKNIEYHLEWNHTNERHYHKRCSK